MDLATDLLAQLNQTALTADARATIRCRLAKTFEESGDYEAARNALSHLWQRVGERPRLEGLNEWTRAEVLLRAGALSGWIGSARQIEGAQAVAKDLISESMAGFERLDDTEKAAEAYIDLAICYWREGAFDEARAMLAEARQRQLPEGSEQKARVLLNLAVVERSATRLDDALRIHLEAAPLFERITNHALKGNYHNQFALVLRAVGTAYKREDYLDRALIEYTAASYHYEQARNSRYRAAVENNLGFLFLSKNRITEAREHLEHARRLYVGLKDKLHTAQVDETRARALLAEKKEAEAERVARSAVQALEEGGEQSLLAEALTTHGVALARLSKHEEAHRTIERAIELAHRAGDNQGAGVAALSLLEELGEELGREERLRLYERSDELLAQTQNPEILARLRSCARKALAPEDARENGDAPLWPRVVYASGEMAEILRRAHRIATTPHTLLLTGETGTGKELLARLVHEWSGRAGEFVSVNCAALLEGLAESELFGHRKGSFTDALEDYPGVIRQAAGGTLLLDEVAELTTAAQAKLLRVIERGEVQTIGAPVPEQVDVRIIAATRQDLKQMVAQGTFREDLFYRLQAFHVEIPPLRERPEDIEALSKHFINEALKDGAKQVTFTPEAIEAMCALPLEGNARQLKTLIERTLLVAADGAVITAEAVETAGLRRTQQAGFANPWEGFSLKEEVRRFEARFIELALKEAKGKVSHAARLLGFKHHESLTSLLETRHRELLDSRLPATPRRRSIIRRK